MAHPLLSPQPSTPPSSSPLLSPTQFTTSNIVSDMAPHDSTASLVPPPRPYAATGTDGISFASPSARTSFTRVDRTSDEEGIHPAMSQDLHNAEESPSPAQGQSQEVEAQTPAQAADEPTPVPAENQPQQEPPVPQTPQAFLTFLLITGKRRTMSFEPGTTVGRVKELMWNSWPNEWQSEHPPAPSYLRVLYLGKMLQDDETLTKLGIPSSLPSAPQAIIVHLSIRPSNAGSDDGGMKKKRRKNDGSRLPDEVDSNSGCCGCIIC